jgi:RNA polymerase sigma factor (sigma-70 family)
MANRQSESVRTQPWELSGSASVAGLSDGQLLARFTAERDELAEVAFAVLVRRHGPMVLHVCQQILGDRHVAEDAFQATFLILARRAGSLRQPDLLGHWLYGVALRTAREARMREDRRRRREAPGPEELAEAPSGEAGPPEAPLVCREEFAILHEEVARLPENERAAVVLCSLEGLTYQEAALRLCCPVGSIGVRLSRARERLRVRLTRRGLAPSAGLLGALFGAEAVSACMSSALFDSTIEAAIALTPSEALATGLVSARVVALAEAVLRTMVFKRLMAGAAIVMTAATTLTLGWFAVHQAPPAAAPAQVQVPMPMPMPIQPRDAAPPRGHRVAPLVVDPPSSSPTVQALLANDPAVPEIDLRAKPAARHAARDERVLGEALFAKEWVRNDPMSHGGDGLGPVYNETSCMACHGLGAPGGAGPETKNVVLLSATPLSPEPAQGLDQVHPGFRGTRSTVLHRFGTDPEYASWRKEFYESNRDEVRSNIANRNEDSIERRIRALREQTTPERRLRDRSLSLKPSKGYSFALSERNPPALFGAGRIDAVPSEVLDSVARQQPTEVRGRVNHTPHGAIGRFGWKAQVASLHEFVRAACANELGLEVPGHPQAIAPLAPNEPAKGLDLNDRECDAMVAYVRALPEPVVVDPTGPRGTTDMQEGRRLFAAVGCTSCHTPTLGDVQGIYSDLLLHDMGASLSDSGNYYGTEGPASPGGPTPSEWRTPPLWGYRDSGPYLHDGRAQSLDEAVALHEAQGKSSARLYFVLSVRERSQIESFLKSLVAPAPATAPGIMPAAEIETRLELYEQIVSEVDVRRTRAEVVTREEQEWQKGVLQRQAEEVAKRARARFVMARDLEKMNKIAAALEFYREIVRLAPGTDEGRQAAARIAALSSKVAAP